MSDEIIRRNRIQMRELCGIRSAPGIDSLYKMSYLSSLLQALFATEEFRIRIILIANQFGNIQALKLHANLSHLFEHMIIGREAYLISDGIIELISGRLPQIQYNLEQNPKIFLENVLQLMYENYKRYKQVDPQYSCPAELFLTQFRVDCKKCGHSLTISRPGKNLWLTSLNVEQLVAQSKPINIQQQIDLFIDNRYYFYGKAFRCPKCNNPSMLDFVWTPPTILVLELRPKESNIVAIEDIINVQNDKYSLFACIVFEPNDNSFSSFTKVAKMWYYFKNKYVKEMPVVKRLNNVCLMFYKKVRSMNEAKHMAEVDIVNVMPNLRLPQQIESVVQFSQHTDIKLSIYPSADSRELTIEEALAQGFENTEGICYMNATIQALYHCQLFRKYIMECNRSLGQFHSLLNKLFTHMYNRNGNKVKKWHQKLYSLQMQVNQCERGGSILEFYDQLLEDLHNEIKEYNAKRGVNNSEQFANKVKNNDYANVGIDREDVASSNAWIQYLAEENNTPIVNLFTIQQISFERCKVGHKNYLTFEHKFKSIIPAEIATDKRFYGSLQDIVNSYQCAVQNRSNLCAQCPVFRELYHFRDGISRLSNIIVFKFNMWMEDKNTGELRYVKLDVEINDSLTIFCDTYHCMAYIVDHNDQRAKHVFTVAQDDNNWWQFNDLYVQLIGGGMPPVSCFLGCENVVMVFYEKKQNVSALRMRTLADTSIHIWQLQHSIDWQQKQLSMQASIVGLYNLYGSTSYLNAVIQCLYHCSEFRKYIIFDQQPDGDSQQIQSLLRWLFVNISMTDLSAIDTHDFWRNFTTNHRMFAAKHEHNAKAFYLCLIEQLLKQRNIENSAILDIDLTLYYARESGVSVPDKYFSDNNFSILNTFAILYESTIYCATNEEHKTVIYKPKYIFETVETISDESLQLMNRELVDENYSGEKCESVQFVIENLLCDAIFGSEVCDACGSNATLVSCIVRTPNILVIELSKVEFHQNVGNRKVNIFPNIRVDEYIEVCGQMYSFRACICCNHPKVDYIHYTAYAKCDRVLYCFDDLTAQPSTKSLHELQFVHILFYEKL